MDALFQNLLWIYLLLAPVTLGVLLLISAPYGRHRRDGWGPAVGVRTGWLLMEIPTIVVFAAVYLSGSNRLSLASMVLAGLWYHHYIYRTFLFPRRLETRGKTMPLLIGLIAFVVQSINATLQAWWLAELGDYPTSWLTDPRFVIGAVVFVVGMRINRQSDNILLALREPGSREYKIPRGGLFRYVSAPNYLGEILEWIGWAIATWSLPGLAFALYTIANLLPRALTNHRWYQEKFPDYPVERKALIPGIL
ncbi:MAG: protein-S-isoprenylcysteine O-methyltransferase Ste14 [Myxococcota bacterium]|jgi:protein-S-isoprenylcysteine O-methyltransferase Ste14